MGEKVYVEEVPDVPTGDFYAKVVKYERYEGKYDPAVRIYFMIAIGKVAVGPINGIFPCKATSANKTGKLLLATLGECTVDRTYDLDSLIDKRCWVKVIREVTDDGPVSRVKKALYPPPNAAVVRPGDPGDRNKSDAAPGASTDDAIPPGMPF